MADININKIYTSKKAPSELLPPRDSEGHKGTFGKVLLIAGSRNMAGAAILAARSAYRTGAGMVKVISPECNRVIIQIAIPEALYMPSESSEEEWIKAFEWCDCIGIGSGIGTDENACESLKKALTLTDKPILIDADGLNILNEVIGNINVEDRDIVMTPHMGELNRLVKSLEAQSEESKQSGFAISEGKTLEHLNIAATEDKSLKQIYSAAFVSEHYKSVLVAKSADTYVVDACKRYSDGEVFKNDRGNSGMATAGSGDVLAGCIVALMGQGMNPYEAACTGVQLHALAGDRAALYKSEAWIMAGDICDNIGLNINNA